MQEVRTIEIRGEEVQLDRSKLYFNEATLSEYIETEGGWIDYFGAKLADAERELADFENELSTLEADYEKLYSEKFSTTKDQGGSDNYVKACVISDPDVEEARKKVIEGKKNSIEAKHNIRLLQLHLRAWDKNHENAQSLGHFIRKEMDRLNRDIYAKQPDNYIEKKIEETIQHIDLGGTDGHEN